MRKQTVFNLMFDRIESVLLIFFLALIFTMELSNRKAIDENRVKNLKEHQRVLDECAKQSETARSADRSPGKPPKHLIENDL